MAPKAEVSKADAKSKAKAKPKKEPKAEEEDKNRIEAPDYEKHQAALAVVQEKIDKLQKEQQAFTAEINGRSAGKEDFFSKKAVIRSELDAVSKEMDVFQEQRDQIRKILGEKKAENAEAKADLSKMKKGMAYTNEVDIDRRIQEIEDHLQHETNTLKKEKEMMLEIKELKKNRPKLAQLGAMKDKVENFDAGTDLRGKQAEINEAMALLREKKKGIQERLTELSEARKAQVGDMGDVMGQRDERQTKIKALIEERNTLRDSFGAQKREFQTYLNEQRRIKQEKYAEDREKQQQEWKIQQLEKKIEALDDQPYVSEITLIEQTIKFCHSLMPSEKEKKEEDKKETSHTSLKDGEEVLMSKDDRDQEMYWVATKAKKSGKKKGGAGGDASKKPIKHNADTFNLFNKLKLDAPITTDEIPGLLTKLEEQKAGFEVKVAEWAANKEDMKRKIKEGIVSMEDLEEKEKEEAKEAEAEKEEEKEEAA